MIAHRLRALASEGRVVLLCAALAACEETNELYPPSIASVVTGTVTAADGIAELPPDEITKDPAVCGSGFRPSERLVLGPDRGIGNVVVSIGGLPAPPGWDPLPDIAPTLSHRACRFDPHVLLVPLSDTLTLHNADPLLHNTHGYLGDRTVFNRALPTAGMRQSVRLRDAGKVRVVCDAGHAWESAWIVVHEHPYFAVTDADGRFRIARVPPGDLVLTAWHEHLGAAVQPVRVPADSDIDVQLTYQPAVTTGQAASAEPRPVR